MEIITGRTGQKHVLPSDDGRINRTLLGKGDYILYEPEDTTEGETNQFKLTVTSATTVTIGVGYLVSQGRHAANRELETIDLSDCVTGEGQSRMVVIVAEYNENEGIESFTLKYEMGASFVTGTTPHEPTITTGDIDAGERHQVPLWRLQVNHFSIDESSIQRVLTTEILKTDALTRVLNFSQNILSEIDNIQRRIKRVTQFLPVNDLTMRNVPVSRELLVPFDDFEKPSYMFDVGDVVKIHINGLKISSDDYSYTIYGDYLKITFDFVTDESSTDVWNEVCLEFYRLGESVTPPEPTGTAYAVFDSADGSLVFFRSEETYTEGQVEGTKTYYTGVETGSHGWSSNSADILSVRFADIIKPSSTVEWFKNCNALQNIGRILLLDTSDVTNMDSMFDSCQALASLNVSGFDTSNVTNMNKMFSDCRSLTSLDLSGFNTSKVTNMNSLVGNCSTLTSLDLSGFNTSNVTNMGYMFGNCRALTSLDVSSFNTSKVSWMPNMFYNCKSLTLLDLSGFDTSMVSWMDYMFRLCDRLRTTITLRNSTGASGDDICKGAADEGDAEIILKYASPVTSAQIDAIVSAAKQYNPNSNIVNGGQA